MLIIRVTAIQETLSKFDLDSYIDAGVLFTLSPGAVIQNPPYNYNFNARVFNIQAGNTYADPANDLDEIGEQGMFNPKPSQGSDPLLNREALMEPLGCALEIYEPIVRKTSGGESQQIKLWKIYHVTMGSADFA